MKMAEIEEGTSSQDTSEESKVNIDQVQPTEESATTVNITENQNDVDQNSQEEMEPVLSESEMEEKRRKESELLKYWKTVEDNPMDFTGWTYLLQYVEQEGDPESCRKVYESFFSHYPYCYGYWKKYSDMEHKHGNLDKAVEVFEKGLRAIPLSVELWLHYLNFFANEFVADSDTTEKLRALYKRALAAAGLDFRSDKLWDAYISWEKSNKNFKAVTSIYEDLIGIPTQLYSHHWDNFCRFVEDYHPKEILDIDTFLKLRSIVVNKSSNNVYEEDEVGLDEALNVMEPPDSDAPPGMSSSLMGDEKEVKKIRAKYLEEKEVIYKATVLEVSKRWVFEETIRRPYFHVKPLERGQLKNWRDYLEFEIDIGDHNRTVVLFERSMIACALYEDFWMKYAKYLELHSIDGVRSVYQRACDIHLPKKPYIHLAWAAFEERKDNYVLARKILLNIENNVPGLAMVCMRRISLERRQSNHEAAESLFKTYIEKAVSHKARTFFSIKYARYLQKVVGDVEKARKVLTDSLDIDNTNEKVFLQLLDVEYQMQPVEEDRVLEIFSRVFKSDVSLEFKVKVSQRRMEFLEDFGNCIQKISEAYDEHQKLVKEHSSKKKRPDREPVKEEPPDKKMKTIDIAVPPPMTPSGLPPPMNYDSNIPPPPPNPHVPPPDPGYAYGHWPGTGYGNSMAYPSYPYPSYPPQYNYYGY